MNLQREPSLWPATDWKEKAKAWVALTIRPEKLILFVPIKEWSIACVALVDTSHGRFYFKASPPALSIEPRVTFELSKYYPDWIPEVVAYQPLEHWFLQREFSVLKCEDHGTEDRWKRILSAYATIQYDWVNQLELVKQWGCIERPLSLLESQIDTLDEEVTGVDGLTGGEASRLIKLIPILKEKCREVASLGLPLTLDHGDLHFGNVLNNQSDFVIIDWSDACITQPVLSLASLFTHIEEENELKNLGDSLIQFYFSKWSRWVQPGKLWMSRDAICVCAWLHAAMSYHCYLLPGLGYPAELVSFQTYWLRKILGIFKNEGQSF